MRTLNVICLVGLLAAGCLKTVTMRTAIEDDGAVERSIRIESDDRAPPVASDIKLPAKDGWQVYKSEEKLFEARGKFKSVADIPLDYEKIIEIGDGEHKRTLPDTSKSVKSHRVFRCALFNVHEYTETITDTTSREEFNKMVEKAIALRAFGFAILEKAYGDEFDFADLKAYVEKEVVPRVRRLAATYWEARTDKRAEWDKRFAKSALKIAAEVGVQTTEEQMKENGAEDLVVKWAVEKTAQLVKRKDGQAFTAEQAKERIEKLEKDEKVSKAAAELVGKYVEGGDIEWFGGMLGARVLGAYLQVMKHDFQFEASVVMPGEVVETNGLTDENGVSWSFTHEDVFPGYVMRARSVVFTKANQPRAGRSVIPSAKAAIRLAEFAEGLKAEDRGKVLKALEESARVGTVQPLQRLAQDEMASLQAVLKQAGMGE